MGALGDVKDVAVLALVGVGAYLIYQLVRDPAKVITEQTSLLTTFGNPVTAWPYRFGESISQGVVDIFKGIQWTNTGSGGLNVGTYE